MFAFALVASAKVTKCQTPALEWVDHWRWLSHSSVSLLGRPIVTAWQASHLLNLALPLCVLGELKVPLGQVPGTKSSSVTNKDTSVLQQCVSGRPNLRYSLPLVAAPNTQEPARLRVRQLNDSRWLFGPHTSYIEEPFEWHFSLDANTQTNRDK